MHVAAVAFPKRKRIPSGSVNMDEEAKLMRSRVSARDCRARKKQRYQKLEAMVDEKEKSIIDLRKELQQVSTKKKSDIAPPFLRRGVIMYCACLLVIPESLINVCFLRYSSTTTA